MPSYLRAALGAKTAPRLCCVGSFEQNAPELVAVVVDDSCVRLLAVGGQDAPRTLRFNDTITCIASARFPGRVTDLLVVGSSSSIIAFDVNSNCGVFFADVPEGAGAIAFGALPGSGVDEPLIFVGGTSSLQGFDEKGQERFWTVIGGSVAALDLCDVNGDGTDELLVGSDDFEIRAFQHEESLFEITETESVIDLIALGGSRFAYALSNGTVGVYDGMTRLWRVRGTENLNCMVAFDMDGDGITELVIGWSGGKLEARRVEDGKVVFWEVLSSSVTNLAIGRFAISMSDPEMICCTQNGDVRGYAAGSKAEQDEPEWFEEGTRSSLDREHFESDRDHVASSLGFIAMVEKKAPMRFQEEFRNSDLMKLQEDLTVKRMELQSLEDELASKKSGKNIWPGTLPTGANASFNLRRDLARRSLVLQVSLNAEEFKIDDVIVFAFDAGIFDEECIAQKGNGSSSCEVELNLLRNVETVLQAEVLVSARGSNEYVHVFEEAIPLPRFSTFVGKVLTEKPIGKASFMLEGIRAQDLEESVLKYAFDVEEVSKGKMDNNSFHFCSVSNQEQVVQIWTQEVGNGDLCCHVYCDDMKLASQVVQEISTRLSFAKLAVSLDFPADFEALKSLMKRIQELITMRQKLGAEVADESNFIKTLIVRAEDARVLQDVKNLQQTYQNLTTLNMQVIAEYMKRSTNRKELLSALKEVNEIIQRAANFRVGPPHKAVINLARNAMKNSNINSLLAALGNS